MNYSLGVAIPLILSLLIVTPQIRSRKLNLLDVTSVIYFSLAVFVTYFLNINVFVERSRFLGFFALSIMAFVSLIAKRPFTLQVSKMDYPEIYWKDKLFLTINNIITFVWGIVFMVCAFIYLFIDKPFIASSIAIAFGIAFSIIFPLKAPAYFAIKDFKKYDWKVDIEGMKDKDYDVIVIGSGVGGLICGALLSKRGYRVLILEKNHQVGGYCQSFKRKGYTFNAGVVDVSGLWEKGPLNYLLKQLNLKKEDFFSKNKTKILFKGREIEIPDSLDELIDTLSQMFPDERENIRKFFEEAKKAYEEVYKDNVFGVPLPEYLIVKVFGSKKLLNYPQRTSKSI